MWNQILNWLGSFFGKVADFGDDLFRTVLGWCEQFFPTVDWSPVLALWNQANWFFPVDLCVTYAYALAQFWAWVQLFRWGRSWLRFLKFVT